MSFLDVKGEKLFLAGGRRAPSTAIFDRAEALPHTFYGVQAQRKSISFFDSHTFKGCFLLY